MSDVSELRGSASLAGYHYLNLLQTCGWRFHLRYNKHYVPRLVSRYLVFGQVMHLVFEAFYKKQATALDCDSLVALFKFELQRRREMYAKADDYIEDLERGPIMLHKWYDSFGATDADNYEYLAVEETMLFTLPGGYVMSVKPDMLWRERATGNIYCLEHKTTSRSAGEMAKRVACEMQVDAQILGSNEWLRSDPGHRYDGLECAGVIPDVLYKRQSVCTATRDTIVTRTRKELADAQLTFAGLFSDIASKREALDEGVVPELLYARNGGWCGNFGCEYSAICHAHYAGVPTGFLLAEGDGDEDFE